MWVDFLQDHTYRLREYLENSIPVKNIQESYKTLCGRCQKSMGPSIVFHMDHEVGETRMREDLYGSTAKACGMVQVLMLMPCMHTVWLNHSPWTIQIVANTKTGSWWICQRLEQATGVSGRIHASSMSSAVRVSMINTFTMERRYARADISEGRWVLCLYTDSV